MKSTEAALNILTILNNISYVQAVIKDYFNFIYETDYDNKPQNQTENNTKGGNSTSINNSGSNLK
jgi:hypothetical protein